MSTKTSTSKYIIDGIYQNFRIDGRTSLGFRYLKVTQNILENCMGSAQVLLGNPQQEDNMNNINLTPDETIVTVGIKPQVIYSQKPIIRVSVFLPTCSKLTPKNPDNLSNWQSDISSQLEKLYSHSSVLDKLEIAPDRAYWQLDIHCVIQSYGGNITDAASIAITYALANLQVPTAEFTIDPESKYAEVSLQHYESTKHTLFQIDQLPIHISLYSFKDAILADPICVEELTAHSRFSIGMLSDRILFIEKRGDAMYDYNLFMKIMKTIPKMYNQLTQYLIEAYPVILEG